MSEEKKDDGKWAPWYVYVVIIVGCNLLKQQLIEGIPAVANVAITLVLIAVLFTVITAVYRAMRGDRQRQS